MTGKTQSEQSLVGEIVMEYEDEIGLIPSGYLGVRMYDCPDPRIFRPGDKITITIRRNE